MCRCQGYVYTYRLQKDVSGSWAADVRHLILLPSIVNLGFIRCTCALLNQAVFASFSSLK